MLDEFSLWKTAVYAERRQLIHGGCAQQSEKSSEMENGDRRREGGSEKEGRKGARVSRVQRATQQLHFHLDRRKRVAAMVA